MSRNNRTALPINRTNLGRDMQEAVRKMKEIPGGVEVEIVEGRARQHWTRYNCRCFFKSMPVPMPRKSGVKCTSNVPDEVSSSWCLRPAATNDGVLF